MTHREENIVNISMMASALLKDGKIEYDDASGHLGMTDFIISLADRFEKEYAGVDWDSDSGDYWEEIDSFAEKELLKQFGREQDPPGLRLNVNLPEDPVKVYAVAGSVKHEIFSGNLDECKTFCDEKGWVHLDENMFEWDLEMEDSRDDLLPDDYYEALSYYCDQVGRDVESEFTRVNADKLVFCYHYKLEFNDFDYWARYEEICGEALSYDEYKAVDASFDGSPYDVGDEAFETIASIKRSVNDFRTAQVLLNKASELDQLIRAAKTQREGFVPNGTVNYERDSR